MAVLTIEIPDNLLAKLEHRGRPAQELLAEALEQMTSAENQIITSDQPVLSKAEVLQRLLATGFIRDPAAWDNEDARAWRELPEQEKEAHIREMESLYFPDAPASRAVIRGRKHLDQNVSRAEVERRLRQAGLIRPRKAWDTLAARQWEMLPEAEKQAFIAEMNSLYLPDSPASNFLIESRR